MAQPAAAPADIDTGSTDAIAGSNMAPFLTKLFQIVSASSTDRCITWTSKGDSFVISDPDTFARDILPTYFKHNNIRSFIRQLNTYGFRKRTNISSTDEHLEFFHEKFRRDQPTLLVQIKRCHQSKPQSRPAQPGLPATVVPEEAAEAAISKAAPDMDTIRKRVGELKSRLGALQSEIRDYNTQMEHKVNVLMQILQTSGPGPNQTNLALPAPNIPQLQQTSAGQQQHPTPQQQPGITPPQHSATTALAAQQAQQPSAAHHQQLMQQQQQQQQLLQQLQQVQQSQNGMCNPMGLQLPQSTLGSGLNAITGLGLPGLGGGIGGIGGMNASLANGLMGQLNGLGALSNAQKSGEVAGLQHLLEAAQRYHTSDEGKTDPASAKRFHADMLQGHHEQSAHA